MHDFITVIPGFAKYSEGEPRFFFSQLDSGTLEKAAGSRSLFCKLTIKSLEYAVA